MGRPKKEKPNHGKYHEAKVTIGHDLKGKPIRKSFYSLTSIEDAKQQGKQWQIEQEVAKRTGEPFIEQDVSFSVWAKKWLEVYKKPNVDGNTYHLTYEQNVNNHLIPYFGKAIITDIKPIDIQKFFDLNSSFSDSVLKKLHMCLTGIFESAIENDVCRKNPVRHISVRSTRAKNVKHVYSDKQIEKAKNYTKSRMPEIYILLCSGIRRGELIGLKWDDVKNKSIAVKRSLADIQSGTKSGENQELPNLVAPGIKENPPKWNSYRVIPIDDECAELLSSLPHNGDYVFPKSDGKPQGPNTWSQKLKRFMLKMNADNPDIPVLSAHELRHTFGTMLRRHGVDIYTIQKIMGHKDIKMTTEIYVHNEVDVLRRGLKLGTGVVRKSYGNKYHIKRNKKRATQSTENS